MYHGMFMIRVFAGQHKSTASRAALHNRNFLTREPGCEIKDAQSIFHRRIHMTSRKDYVAIAAIIQSEKAYQPEAAVLTAQGIAERIADHFASTNPLFDRARFLKAA